MPKPIAHRFNLRPSRRLFYWLCATHGLAVIVVLMVSLAGWVKGLLLLGLAILFKRGWVLAKIPFTTLTVDPSGCWQLRDAAHNVKNIVLLGESMVTSWLITLHYRVPSVAAHSQN